MDYAILDHPEILALVFHPRPEQGSSAKTPQTSDHLIAVEPGVQVGGRFHVISPSGANLLFFHGNGEIVADYDALGPLYNNLGMNLLCVDYRGYGRSSGTPSVSAMMADCHVILSFVRQWLAEHDHNGPLIVMGRSLGSASALELATQHADQIDALIIESGFAFTLPLLKLLGADPAQFGCSESDGFSNLEKIRQYQGPTLIIHGEYDAIIPFSDAMALYKASTAQDKSLLKIDKANHNDIFLRGLDDYMQAIHRLAGRLMRSHK
jgi:pimeloyl-ACP methyl ester carboxylesterase